MNGLFLSDLSISIDVCPRGLEIGNQSDWNQADLYLQRHDSVDKVNITVVVDIG